MNPQQTIKAEAWPISHVGAGYRPVLEQVIVKSHHPDGNGVIHLSPEQALYVHSRLSNVTTAFLTHHNGDDALSATPCPNNQGHPLSQCNAEVWPISHETEHLPPVLEKVVVESNHPDGRGIVHLTPAQAHYIHSRLTHINLAFLHENAWGGEDASAQ